MKEFCEAMVKQGLLRTEMVSFTEPSTLIPSLFLDHVPSEKTQQQVLYFADLRSCFAKKLPVLEYLD